MNYARGMDNYGEPCEYCVNYNELCDALNLVEVLEETVQATWDGVREMLEEVAEAFGVPVIGHAGPLTNGELVTAIIGRAKPIPQNPTVAESADALYYALHEIIGSGQRCWPTEVLVEGHDEEINRALDIYEKAKSTS